MRFSDERLQQLRFHADPLADQVIAALGRQGGPHAVGSLLRSLVSGGKGRAAPLPALIEDWLRDHARLPDGVDWDRINRASALYVSSGVSIYLILGSASLIECYGASRGVKILTYSNRLGQETRSRIFESAYWVSLILAPDGLTPRGQGVRAAYKVRLMHAAIRHMVSQTGRWDTEALGVPLNQEDMAGTLMTFSHTIVRCLPLLGRPVTEQEANDFLYLWGVVGSMMGVRSELIPAGLSEARELSGLIYGRQHAPSSEGVQMTRALLAMYADLMPGRYLAGFFSALIRHLSGDRLADWLEVPRTQWETVIGRYRLVGLPADLAARVALEAGTLARRLGLPLLPGSGRGSRQSA